MPLLEREKLWPSKMLSEDGRRRVTPAIPDDLVAVIIANDH